jgi:2-dehydro-3-deoxyphosphogluconate aldolase/(4S)-4-hydroxy-2-oxoglutarate aldolase
MNKQSVILKTLKTQGILPLFYHEDPDTCLKVMHSLYDAGIRLIEFTNRGQAALENFRLMQAEATHLDGLYLGIGTIKDAAAAEKFIGVGADFLVSPALVEEVNDAAEANDILWIPGCMTPTEITTAGSWNIDLVKLFPGNVLGPGYVSAIKDIFPNMSFMPTGGVDTSEENLKDWFGAGVVAVGMGSKLISKELLDQKNFDTIQQSAKEVFNRIQSIKL